MDTVLPVDQIEIITLQGLSQRGSRFVALAATVLIWCFVGGVLVGLASRLEAAGQADQVGLTMGTCLLLHYILTGRFLFSEMAWRLVAFTPLAALYRSDKKVLDRAREHLLRLSETVSFSRYLDYSKINPSIADPANFEVLGHQKAGTLATWLGDVRNLKVTANLVYQILLVERAILAGDYSRP